MRFGLILLLILVFRSVSHAQDRLILNNGDTVLAKINKQNNNSVEYQLVGESLTQVMSIYLINSIVLGSGRIMKTQTPESNKIAPVFGSYKGSCVVTSEENDFGLTHLRSGSVEEFGEQQIITKIKVIAAMTGACLATYKLNKHVTGFKDFAKVEYYGFASQPNFIKEKIVGKIHTLAMLDSYMLGQSELLSLINKETVNHSIQFSDDGKIIEDGHVAGSYTVNQGEIDLKYNYTNKKGKIRIWQGVFKVGSVDRELIQLYSENYNFTSYQNIILRVVNKY